MSFNLFAKGNPSFSKCVESVDSAAKLVLKKRDASRLELTQFFYYGKDGSGEGLRIDQPQKHEDVKITYELNYPRAWYRVNIPGDKEYRKYKPLMQKIENENDFPINDLMTSEHLKEASTKLVKMILDDLDSELVVDSNFNYWEKDKGCPFGKIEREKMDSLKKNCSATDYAKELTIIDERLQEKCDLFHPEKKPKPEQHYLKCTENLWEGLNDIDPDLSSFLGRNSGYNSDAPDWNGYFYNRDSIFSYCETYGEDFCSEKLTDELCLAGTQSKEECKKSDIRSTYALKVDDYLNYVKASKDIPFAAIKKGEYGVKTGVRYFDLGDNLKGQLFLTADGVLIKKFDSNGSVEYLEYKDSEYRIKDNEKPVLHSLEIAPGKKLEFAIVPNRTRSNAFATFQNEFTISDEPRWCSLEGILIGDLDKVEYDKLSSGCAYGGAKMDKKDQLKDIRQFHSNSLAPNIDLISPYAITLVGENGDNWNDWITNDKSEERWINKKSKDTSRIAGTAKAQVLKIEDIKSYGEPKIVPYNSLKKLENFDSSYSPQQRSQPLKNWSYEKYLLQKTVLQQLKNVITATNSKLSREFYTCLNNPGDDSCCKLYDRYRSSLKNWLNELKNSCSLELDGERWILELDTLIDGGSEEIHLFDTKGNFKNKITLTDAKLRCSINNASYNSSNDDKAIFEGALQEEKNINMRGNVIKGDSNVQSQ